MSKKVLIVYGSRFGSTEEISLNFKQTLEENGFIVDLIDLKSKNKKIPNNIDNYSGVSVSGVSVSNFLSEIHQPK